MKTPKRLPNTLNPILNVVQGSWNACFGLLALFILCVTPTASHAQLTYLIAGNAVTITGYSGPGGAVAIPEALAGLPVTRIGRSAFEQCLDITSVSIPETVTTIDTNAFWGCGFTSVTIPASVTNIGFQAFCNSSLREINVDPLNPSYSSLDGVLFDKDRTLLIQCPSPKEGDYVVPSGVTSIGWQAFWNCMRLTSVTLPDSVTNLTGRAFYLSRLERLSGGKNICAIGSEAFAYNCLTSFAIPERVTSVADATFNCCIYLTSVSFGKNVTLIGSAAFKECSSLAAITIPDTVRRIGDGAFGVCRSLSTVTIGSGVSRIESLTFGGSGLTSVTIPDNVRTIGEAAFGFCPVLTNVIIGNGVTSLEWHAFVNCPSLERVTLGRGITNMEAGAFQYCANLTAMYFPGDAPVTDLHEFDGCTNLIVYYLPGTTGWGPTFGGRPTAFWTLPAPVVMNKNPAFGLQTNRFGFLISWATNASVVVEACTDLSLPIWSPVSTNALTLNSGSTYFSDPDWAKYPRRLYRLRPQ